MFAEFTKYSNKNSEFNPNFMLFLSRFMILLSCLSYGFGSSLLTPSLPGFQINTTETFDTIANSIANLSNGKLILVFSVKNEGNYSIFGRILNFSGSSVTPDFQINQNTSISQEKPVVVALNNGFVVAWQKRVSFENQFDIVGVIFNDNQNISNRTTEFTINTYTKYDQIEPQVTALLSGGFFVTWSSYFQDGSEYGVYGKFYDEKFDPGAELAINSYTTNNQTVSSVCTLLNGNVVVVWTSFVSIEYLEKAEIFGQILTSNGIKVGDEFKINSYTFENQSFPVVSSLPNGNFIVAWLSYYPPPFKYNVRGQIFTSDGQKYGLEILISKYALIIEDPCNPTTNVLTLQNNAFLTLYFHQFNNDTFNTGQGFYAQFIDYKGDKIEEELHLEGNVETYQQIKPLGVSLNESRILIVLSVLSQGQYHINGYFYDVSFDIKKPNLVNNSINLMQGQKVLLTSEMLDSDQDVSFLIVSTINGHFESLTNEGIALSKFTSDDVNKQKIFFCHSGTPNKPLVKLQLRLREDIFVLSDEISLNFSYKNGINNGNIELIANSFLFVKDQSVLTINSGNLKAKIGGLAENGIIFYVFDVKNCKITSITSSSLSRSQFFQSEINSNSLILTLDSQKNSPSFTFVISDNSSFSAPISAQITLTSKFADVEVPMFSSEFRVDTNNSHYNFEPQVVMKKNGEFFVSWPALAADHQLQNIIGQFFDKSCSKLGDEIIVNDYITGAQDHVAVGATEKGTIIASWASDEVPFSYGFGGYASVLNGKVFLANSQSNTIPAFMVSTIQNSMLYWMSRTHPTVVGGADNDFIIIWQQYPDGDKNNFGIYGRKYDYYYSSNDIFRVSGDLGGDKHYPSVARFSNGAFVVVWYDGDPIDGSGFGVFGQMFYPNTSKMGQMFQINIYTLDNQRNGKVAVLDDSRFVVVWESDGNDGDGSGIFARIFDTQNMESTSNNEFQVNTYFKGAQTSPAVTVLPDSKFVVVWVSWNQDGSKEGIFAQKMDFDGNKVGYEFRVNQYTNSQQINPSISSDQSGCFVIVWNSHEQGAHTMNNVYGQKFCKTENEKAMIKQNIEYYIYNEVPVSDWKSDQASFLAGQLGVYIAVWQHYAEESDYQWDIIAQRFDNCSNPLGERFLVNTYRHSDQTYPTIKESGTGFFVVTWMSYGQDGDDLGVYGQVLALNGSKIGSEFQIHTVTTGAQRRARVSINKYEIYVIVWEHYPSSQSTLNGVVLGQKFKFPNEKVETVFQVNEETAANIIHTAPEVSLNMRGDFVVLWFVDEYGVFGHYFNYYEERDYKDFHLNVAMELTWIHRIKVHLFNDGTILWAFDCESSFDGALDWSYRGVFYQMFKFNSLLGLIEITKYTQANTFVLADQVLSGMVAYEEGFLMVWYSSYNDGDNNGVFAQRFDAFGNRVGLETQINTYSNGSQSYGKPASANPNHLMIFWYGWSDIVQNPEIKAQNYFLMDSASGNQNIIGIELIFSFKNVDPIDLEFSSDHQFVYVLDSNGHEIVFDRSEANFLNQQILLNLNISYSCCQVQKSDKLYVFGLEEKMAILSLKGDNQVIFDSNLDLGVKFVMVALEGEYLFAVTKTNELYVYDTQNDNFKVISIYDMSDYQIKKIFVKNSRIYCLTNSESNALLILSFNSNFSISVVHTISLFGSGNSITMNAEVSYAFVGSDYGLEILDLRADPITIALSLPLALIADVAISPSGKYLSVSIRKNLYLYNIENPLNPFMVMQEVTMDSVIRQAKFSEGEEYIFVLGSSINMIRIIYLDYSKVMPRFSLGGIQVIDGPATFLTINQNETFALIGSDSQSVVIDISNMNASTFRIVKDEPEMKMIRNLIFAVGDYAYTIDNTSVILYNCDKNQLDFQKKSSLLLEDGPVQIHLSKNDEHLFVLTNTKFMILHSFNLSLLSLITFSDDTKIQSYKMALTTDESTAFVAFGVDPLLIIDLKDKSNLKIKTPLEYSSIILDLSTIERDGEQYLLVTGSQSLVIYKFISNDLSLNLITEIKIAPNTKALKILSDNYVILQSKETLTLVNVKNISLPIVFDSIETQIYSTEYQFSIVSNKFIVLPTFEVVGLFSYGLDLYPSIKVSNYNKKKRFDIIFYAVSLDTGGSEYGNTKILKVDSKPSLPDWITVDCQNRMISLYPTSVKDIILFTSQLLEVTFSKKLDQRLLSDDEIVSLMSHGFLNIDGYPTLDFGPNANSDSFSNNVNFIVSKYYFIHSLIFSLDDFLILNRKPILNIDIYSQFLKAYSSYINVETKIDFQFDVDSFIDPDDDEIVYSIENLPSFLNFDNQIRRFSGIASKKDMGNYTIIIIASDNFETESTSFIMQINNKSPFIKGSSIIPTQNKSLGTDFTFDIPKDLFQDPDSDTLDLTVTCSNKGLPTWLSFNKDLARFTGTPGVKEVAFFPLKKLYYQEFPITITACDIVGNSVSVTFKLIYMNKAPKVNPKKRLQEQFDNCVIKISGSPDPETGTIYEISFDSDSFIDDNKLTLKFEGYLGSNSPLPTWIKFDANSQKLLVQPTEDSANSFYEITLVADNGYQKHQDSFKFYVKYSTIYVVELVAKIIGPIIGIFGIVKYRSYVILFFFKKNYQYYSYGATPVGSQFQKRIYLVYDNLILGHKLVKHLKKKSSKDSSKNWILNMIIDSYMDSEKFYLTLTSVRNKLEKDNQDLIIDDKLLLPDNTLYVVVQGLLISEFIEYYSLAKKTYVKLRNMMILRHSRNWYLHYVKIVDEERDLEFKKFPKIEISEEKFKSAIDSMIPSRRDFPLCCLKRKAHLTDLEYKLLLVLLKSEVLGTGGIKKHQYGDLINKSEGESILVPTFMIQTMESRRIFKSTYPIINQINGLLFLNYQALDDPLKQLPPWLNYEIHDGIMDFYGTPTGKDVGLYGIRILDKNRIIILEFQIKIKDEKTKLNDHRSISKTLHERSSSKLKGSFTINCQKAMHRVKEWNPHLQDISPFLESPKSLEKSSGKKGTISLRLRSKELKPLDFAKSEPVENKSIDSKDKKESVLEIPLEAIDVTSKWKPEYQK